MRIDAHQHFWIYNEFAIPGLRMICLLSKKILAGGPKTVVGAKQN